MKNKITSLLIFFVSFCFIIVFCIFGVILYEEFVELEVAVVPENFQTEITTEKSTVDNKIKAPEIVDNPLDGAQNTNNNSNTQKINYDNISVNKYFYNQLEDYSKTIYKAFESNKEQMKSGNAKINIGDSFSSLLSLSDGQDKLGKYYQSAIEAYTYDNPDVFYLSPNKMYLNIETTTSSNGTSYNVYVDSGQYANYFADDFNSEAEVKTALNEVQNIKNQIVQQATGNKQNDIKMVHDYLVETIEYDTSISRPNIYNIYGALVNKICVCEGYARAFKYILDNIGINCVLVIGTGTNTNGETENHAWNYVELEGIWYAVDTTWDDPVITGGGRLTDSDKYRYFLKGSSEMSKDHTPSGQFTQGGKVFTYPNLCQ